ncbi:hyoscyamine 6-dioxygenase-like [Quercus lobata]|uniref:Fe2OG dioxygenase domain-containing protein n=1 Tax=Quercus lobata TaxID=97700 RepID=A0A7N2MJ57_QUELO|nr:hyoscyamine 6-dioxygenase-like [Quercus lobata]XP_030933814.1 hyoscyamine 6-dioxygenase-like [Quercus lobata]
MEHLVSSWYNDGSLPESYIVPPEDRPGMPSLGENIPVVDLGAHDHTTQILKASQEFGMFQVINHEVPRNVIDEAMSVFKEFHALSAEDKAIETSKSCYVYTSTQNYATERFHFWRDGLFHQCNPLQKYIQFWPEKPPKYREVVAIYTAELRKLGFRILEFIAQGLGVNPDHFRNELGENETLLVNHYPPCPDPSLTLGLGKHRDPVVINILLQSDDVHGLQVFKDEEWIGVEPIPDAFVVTVGALMQIISNGKLKAAEHRVVTNLDLARTTASFALNPFYDTLIEPAKALVDASNPALYKSFSYNDFISKYRAAASYSTAFEQFLSSTPD